VERSLIKLQDLQKALGAHLQISNQMVEKATARGNIALRLEEVQFSLPCRVVVVQGKRVKYILLEGEPEPTDTLIGVAIP
jgi:hypothetical protein